MEIHNIHEAKTNFSRLVERVRGDPVAKLVPFDRTGAPRRGGQWRGRVRIAADFDDLPADLADAFGAAGD